jgi:hypothetical protein
VSEGLPSVWSLVPAAVGGFVLSLPGLVPSLALMAGVDPQVAREACRVYVFERLSHHLVFHSFEPWFIARYAVLLAAGLILFWTFRKRATLWRVNLVVTGAVGISLVGIALDQWFVVQANVLGQTEAEYQAAAGPLLRYYWFRLADVLVPASVALGAVYGLHALSTSRPKLASWLLIGAILAAGGDLAAACARRAVLRVPGAIVQQHPTTDTRRPWWTLASAERHSGRSLQVPDQRVELAHVSRSETATLTAREWLAHWQAVCGWIAESTPKGAKFLTPRQQQTFKWYAGRAEVPTWKDIPQDAAGLMEWKAAFDEIHPPSADHRRHDLAAFRVEELVALAHRYGCEYVVIDRTRSSRPIELARVYPLFAEENPAFEVYRVPDGEQH